MNDLLHLGLWDCVHGRGIATLAHLQCTRSRQRFNNTQMLLHPMLTIEILCRHTISISKTLLATLVGCSPQRKRTMSINHHENKEHQICSRHWFYLYYKLCSNVALVDA